jgi:hypothetical protein
MGAITQIRILGGLVGVGIGEVILSRKVWSGLSSFLSPTEVKLLLSNVSNVKHFTQKQQTAIRASYEEAFNLQFRIMMYITIVCFVICLGCWVRNPIEVRDMEKIETAKRNAQIEGLLKKKEQSSKVPEQETLGGDIRV